MAFQTLNILAATQWYFFKGYKNLINFSNPHLSTYLFIGFRERGRKRETMMCDRNIN